MVGNLPPDSAVGAATRPSTGRWTPTYSAPPALPPRPGGRIEVTAAGAFAGIASSLVAAALAITLTNCGDDSPANTAEGMWW
jgi:hypothetical protein